MDKSKWNKMVSIPVTSLTHEELKEAIQEWSEGCCELEQLLWACYNNGLETSGSHVSAKGNYVDFVLSSASTEQAKRVLSAAEASGFAKVFISFGGNPLSGPTWYQSVFSISTPSESFGKSCLSLANALENESYKMTHHCFVHAVDFVTFFEDKLTGLVFDVILRNHNEYEFVIRTSGNQQNWSYFSTLFGSLGMEQKTRDDNPSSISWYIKRSSAEEFDNAIKHIHEQVISHWSLETPTEITEDMGFNERAMVIRNKFGSSPEGIKKMNDWINENFPHPNHRMVNY